MDILWHDSEALNGRGMPGEYVGEADINLGPSNKRELPCNGCERKAVCGVENVDCVAFRTWCEKGNYADETVGLKLKAL